MHNSPFLHTHTLSRHIEEEPGTLMRRFRARASYIGLPFNGNAILMGGHTTFTALMYFYIDIQVFGEEETYAFIIIKSRHIYYMHVSLT